MCEQNYSEIKKYVEKKTKTDLRRITGQKQAGPKENRSREAVKKTVSLKLLQM